MYDLKGTERFFYLQGYINGLDEKKYENFIREVERVSNGNLKFIDIFKGARERGSFGNGVYPNFSADELAYIETLYTECKSGHINNIPAVDLDEEGKFSEIVSDMSDEEFKNFIEQAREVTSNSIWIPIYLQKIRNGEKIIKNHTITTRIDFSQDEEEDFQKLIHKTLEEYKEKTEDKEDKEIKEGGIVMAEEKEKTPEEIVSEKLGLEVEVINYFQEYVENLTAEEFREVSESITEGPARNFLIHIHENHTLPSVDLVEWIYPPEAKELRKMAQTKYEERNQKSEIPKQPMESAEKNNSEEKMTYGLASRSINDRNLTEAQWISQELGVSEAAFIQFNKDINEMSDEDLDRFLDGNNVPKVIAGTLREFRGLNEVDIEFTSLEERASLVEILNKYYGRQASQKIDVEDIHRKIEEKYMETPNQEAPNQEVSSQGASTFEDPAVKAKMAKTKINEMLEKMSPDELLAFIEEVESNGNERLVTTEPKKSFIEKLKEHSQKGEEIVDNRVDKRKQEIKGEAAYYRAEMKQHIKGNIADVTVEIKKLQKQQKELWASREDIKAELEKVNKELEKLEEDSKNYEENKAPIEKRIDEYDSRINDIEKESKALVKSARKNERNNVFDRFVEKWKELFGSNNKRMSKQEIDAVLEGKSEAPKYEGIGLFKRIRITAKEMRKDSKDYLTSIKNDGKAKIEKLEENKKYLEVKLLGIQEALDAREEELVKAKDLGENRDDEVLSKVKVAEMEIEKWEKELKHLEKLQERVSKLSDRKAYRLSQRGRDKEDGMDR